MVFLIHTELRCMINHTSETKTHSLPYQSSILLVLIVPFHNTFHKIFTFHNIILLILRHYGERMGIHSCKCIHQMGASKRVQIQRTEPHRLLAIHSPAFYVAHHRVRPIACWQTYTTLTTIDCTQLFYHCCVYELPQRLLKQTAKQIIQFLLLAICSCYHTFFYHFPSSLYILFKHSIHPLLPLLYRICTLISYPPSRCIHIPSLTSRPRLMPLLLPSSISLSLKQTLCGPQMTHCNSLWEKVWLWWRQHF